MPTAPFSHTCGLYTIHRQPKASASAVRFLRELRGPAIATEQPEGAPDQGAKGEAETADAE